MTARFTQRIESKGFGEVEKLHGTMSMKKPFMMRWNYEKPKGRTMVSDGDKIWFYDPEENIARFQTVSDVSGAGSPLLFISGEKKLSQIFHVDYIAPKEGEKADYMKLRLIPKIAGMGLKGMLLTFNRHPLSILEIKMVDYLGNKNVVLFNKVERGVALDDSSFSFSPPKGARTIEINEEVLN